MIDDLLAAFQAMFDDYEHRWDKPPPMIAYIAKWHEMAAFLDISIRDGIPLEEVDHARLQADFQKYGFDDYKLYDDAYVEEAE